MDLARWWNIKWVNRRYLTTAVSGTVQTSGVNFIRLDVDLQLLINNEQLRSDYADLRIICQKDDHFINIPYYLVTESNPCRIFFAIQHNAASGTNINSGQHYYLYSKSIYFTESQSEKYININFPQAPYSCHGSGYSTPYGTYVDKHFLRLNDNPASGIKYFTDETGHSSGINGDIAGSGVTKGHSGVLSQSTYFNADIKDGVYPVFSGSYIELPQTADHWGHSSGNWAVDFWFKADKPRTYLTYGGIFYKPVNYTFDKGGFPDVHTYIHTSYPNIQIQANHRIASLYSIEQNSTNIQGSDLSSGVWNHTRVAYRTGGDVSDSEIHIYCNGIKKDTITDDKNNQAMYEVDLTSVFVGWRYDNSTDDKDAYKGFLEQVRYSTFVYPAMTGVDDYECLPDWSEIQSVCGVSDVQAVNSGVATIGGIFYSRTSNELLCPSGIMGGFSKGVVGVNSGVIGGLVESRMSASGLIGGYVTCTIETSGFMGGFTIGSYGDIDIHSVTNLNRVLIKSCSDDQYLQQFSTNARYALYKNTHSNFDAVVRIKKESLDEFDSIVKIEKNRKNPTVQISSLDLNYHTCIIGASGTAYDENNIAFNSGIYNVFFVWGDGDFAQVTNPKASGNSWKASHTYSHSGLYKPLVIVTDKNGRIGSDDINLEMAPTGFGGYIFEYPFINLSGTPRIGTNPLTVDYTAKTSGVVGTCNIFWDFGNGISYYSNALTQTTQYVVPGDYTPIIRIEDASGVYIFDTLKLGYNR